MLTSSKLQVKLARGSSKNKLCRKHHPSRCHPCSVWLTVEDLLYLITLILDSQFGPGGRFLTQKTWAHTRRPAKSTWTLSQNTSIATTHIQDSRLTGFTCQLTPEWGTDVPLLNTGSEMRDSVWTSIQRWALTRWKGSLHSLRVWQQLRWRVESDEGGDGLCKCLVDSTTMKRREVQWLSQLLKWGKWITSWGRL